MKLIWAVAEAFQELVEGTLALWVSDLETPFTARFSASLEEDWDSEFLSRSDSFKLAVELVFTLARLAKANGELLDG